MSASASTARSGTRARATAPELVTGDFSLRRPAPLQANDLNLPTEQFVAKDAYHSAYKPDAPNTPNTQARTMARVAGALSGVSDDVSKVVNSIQAQANAVVADAAVNKAQEIAIRLASDKEKGFTSLRGFDAINRPGGKSLADEYAAQFDESTKEIGKGLKNADQRAAFAQQALGIRTKLFAQATQHETTEFRNYNLSTQDGTISIETNNIGLNYKDPDTVNTSVGRIKGAVAEIGFATGKSAKWIAAAQIDAVSKAHSTALASAMEDGNVVFADAYMRAHKDDINATDMLRVRGAITKELDGRVALAAAKDAVGALVPAFQPTDLDRARGITAQSESGNRERDDKGNLITSPKGAQGKMQVMPDTHRAPGFGVKPAKDDSDAERTRVGNDYFDAMIKRYDGDLALAWAAYNAGPGRLDSALKDSQKPENRGKNWLQLLPAETQGYVTKNLKAYGGGEGRPATPTLADALARLDEDPRINNSPARLQAARTEVKARFEALKADRAASEDDALSTALKAVEANGGNYLALSPSLRAAIPAKNIDTVMSFADKVRSGNTVTNTAVYQRLTDDSYLKGLTDNQFYNLRPELSESDFQHFADQRGALKKPAPGNSAGDLNTPAINMVVQNRLQTLGIDPTPTEKDKAAMAYVGTINKVVREQVLLAQRQQGKKFNDAETEQFIDGLFAKNVAVRNTITGTADGKKTGRALTMTIDDMQKGDITAIRDAFKNRGIKNPSDADIVGAYLRTRALASN
jgi:soluble lytic murein transglycosylase